MSGAHSQTLPGAPAAASSVGPVLALAGNALIWGLSWWPMRWLQAQGLHPLWSTALVYGVVVGLIALLRPHTFGEFWRSPSLWLLTLAAGTTNACFNWGVATGDVVRVVLLFYLMPLWSVLLARWLLKEPLNLAVLLRVLLALSGAALVLWPEAAAEPGVSRWPWPRSLPDWLGVVGGFTFALNTVLLRREAHHSPQSRALAMFLGGVLVAGGLASLLVLQGQAQGLPALALPWAGVVGLLSLLYLASNFALQYGAARLPASVTAVVMLSEVVFAAASAVLLGQGVLTVPLLAGGVLILLAALLSTWQAGAASAH